MFLVLFISTVLILLFLKNISFIFLYLRALKIHCKLTQYNFFETLNIYFKLCTTKENELFDLLLSLHQGKFSPNSLIFFGHFFTALTEPADLKRFLSGSTHIEKGRQYNAVKLWLREGLLTSSGKKWQKRRKMLTPAFHFKILEDSLDIINNNAQILANKLLSTNGIKLNTEKFVSLCTLDIICETAMGKKLDFQKDKASQYVEDIRRVCQIFVLKEVTPYFQVDFVFKLSATYRELKQRICRLHQFTEQVIAERKELFQKTVLDSKKKDRRLAFIDCLIAAELTEPGTFTDLDMREEVDTFMFEGHDTTSTAIIFCLFLLGTEEIVQQKVAEELQSIFKNSDRAVTMEDLQRMKYLEMVIKETLRIYPSVPYFTRILKEDFVLEDGTVLPALTNIAIIPWLLHRTSKYYPNPEKFDPERFNEENCKKRDPFMYIPFSAGPRNCIGQKLAMMEIKVILSTVLRYNKLKSLTKTENVKPVPFIVIKPDQPLFISFTKRQI